MRTASLFIGFAAFLAIPQGIAWADAPTAEQILEHIREREQRYATRHSSAKWTDGPLDEATNWTIETVTQHEDGRIRHCLERFQLGDDGNPAQGERTNEISTYNGSITVSQNWQRLLDEVGSPLSEEQIEAGHAGYHSALLWEGLFDDPHKMRTPWGICQYGLTHGLEDCIATGREVLIEEVTPGTKHYRITFERGDSPEDMTRHVAEIDGDRDWTVSRIEAHRGDVQIREETTSFREDDNGYWVPVAGATQIFGPAGDRNAPVLDWRFEVIDFKVGSEAVSEDAFAIVLEPNSSVYDVRHHVTYHTPAEQLIDPDFDLFALEALLRKLEGEIAAP